jgi:hypothetical protein
LFVVKVDKIGRELIKIDYQNLTPDGSPRREYVNEANILM